MFVSHQHAMPFLRGAGGFARARGCGNAASQGVFLQMRAWQSGYASAFQADHPGSTPGPRSIQRGWYSAASAMSSAAYGEKAA